MSASIDLVAHKLAGMIKKHNDKLHRKRRRDSLSAVEGSVEEVEQEDDGTVEREILNEMEQPYRAIAIEVSVL